MNDTMMLYRSGGNPVLWNLGHISVVCRWWSNPIGFVKLITDALLNGVLPSVTPSLSHSLSNPLLRARFEVTDGVCLSLLQTVIHLKGSFYFKACPWELFSSKKVGNTENCSQRGLWIILIILSNQGSFWKYIFQVIFHCFELHKWNSTRLHCTAMVAQVCEISKLQQIKIKLSQWLDIT